ncbi:MAG TPA: hypothetical protein PLO23_11010, partial [Alphaproteobacteria bacterium]|nr:hypothetical protein [Alphaproteobacteria bacterium]
MSLLAMSHPAEAAPPVCNTTSEGTIVYNKAHLTMQFCNGTNWIAMSGNFGGGGGADNLGDHIATTVLRSDTHNTDDLGTTAIRWKDGWFAGTVTGGTFAGSGASLTALNATNLASGTVPDARFPATLPAVSGANLTNLDASDLATGTVPTARLGSGTANNTTYLRGDGTWQTVAAGADNLGNH